MPGLFFTNVWMLAGLAALSIPVVIHLLLRRKKKRVRFSTIQFFLQQDTQSSQRRKLRHWLLLAIRLSICTLLVCAFARPYFKSGAAGAQRQRKQQLAIVLDRSLSMQARSADGSNWNRALRAAKEELGKLGPEDRAALISCAARAEVLSGWAPAAAIGHVLSSLEPTFERAQLSEGLQEASRLLKVGDPKAASRILVISDLQRSTSQALASSPVPREVEVKVVKTADLINPNIAVGDLQLHSQSGAPPHVVVTSFSDEDARDLKLEMNIDGRSVKATTFSLPAGESTNLALAVPPLTPGWHDVAVHVDSHDALPADDTTFGCLLVPNPIRVLAVETQAGGRSFEQSTFFLVTALEAGNDSSNALGATFACEKVSPDDLAVRLAKGSASAQADLVLIPGLKQVPSALPSALMAFLRTGGGVAVFLDENVSANRYNAQLGEVLPGRLGETQRRAEADLGWRIGDVDLKAGPFAPFAAPHSGDLSLPQFRSRFDVRLDDSVTVLARFDDGAPFIVSRRTGNGQLLLINSSADTSWNNWPKHKTFVPWLHGMARSLAPQRSPATEQSPAMVLTGVDADLDLGEASAKSEVSVEGPEGKGIQFVANEQGQLRGVSLPRPGIYSLRGKAGQELYRLAVNVPPEEGELATVSANDFEQQLVRTAEPGGDLLVAGLLGTTSNQHELWRVLLLLVLVLLFVELVLANRTVA